MASRHEYYAEHIYRQLQHRATTKAVLRNIRLRAVIPITIMTKTLPKTVKEQKTVLDSVLKAQRELLGKYVDKDVTQEAEAIIMNQCQTHGAR